LDWLKENSFEPEHIVFCWGDARMGNTLYSKKDRNVLAIMDWENAFIGDPESDLAWFFLLDRQNWEGFGVPRLEGTPSFEESVQKYEELTGWKVKNLFYHEVMAALRYGISITSSMKALIKKGIEISENQIRDNLATRRLSLLLDLPTQVTKETDAKGIENITVFIQFHMTGPNGYDWYLISDKGKGMRHEGLVDNPTCTVKATADDWAAIQDGKLDRMKAWSSGRLKVDGDIGAMLQLEDMISEFSKTK
jgi:putative sterol carrier protein